MLPLQYDKQCEHCKKPYKTNRWQQKYCSRACSGEAKRITSPAAYLSAQGAEKLKKLKPGNRELSHNTHYVKSSFTDKDSDINTLHGGSNVPRMQNGKSDGTGGAASGGSFASSPQSENFKQLYTSTAVGDFQDGRVVTQPPPHKSESWLAYFLEFIGELKIDSKERGIITLRDSLYRGQWLFLQQVCAGLDAGCREFVVLKARQLGITTISLALDLFWMFVHDGLQSGFVAHEEGSKEKTREIIERYIKSLPRDLKVEIVKHNKYNLVLSNGSIMDYLVAGTTKRTKGLGRGRAYTHIHSTELAFYGNQEAVDSFVAGIAKTHVDRLRIWESTANGFDSPLWEKWSSAKEDTITQRCIFIGWWGNDNYDVSNDAQLMEKYGYDPTPDEQERIAKVAELYQQEITIGMLAWYRWYEATQSKTPHMMAQEFPWTEDEAFISTGSKFFDQKKVAEDIQELTQNFSLFKGYRFNLGERFVDTHMEACSEVRDVTLRVWAKPVEGAKYIISCDPAYGSDDNKDRSVIQVKRCYADKVEQVAEYADDEALTYQVTWVLAWLAGKYKDSMINLEVTGPGAQIMLEFKHLKELATAGMLDMPAEATVDQKQQRDSFLDNMQAARWFIYHRQDSMGGGYAYNWKTTGDTKIAALNALRDSHVTRAFIPRSLPLLDEMTHIVQNGWDIRASGKHHDDRVMAAALAIWGWQEWIRPGMIAENMTKAQSDLLEKAQVDPRGTFMQRIVQEHFASMEQAKVMRGVAAAWDEW